MNLANLLLLLVSAHSLSSLVCRADQDSCEDTNQFTTMTSEGGHVKALGLNGFVAATFSAFDASGSLDLSVVPLQARWLRDTGVGSAFVCGTTGESLKMTVIERKQQTEAWLATASENDLRVIVHVGAESIGDSIDLAKHAQEKGAVAISAMASVFFKPANAIALAKHIAAIAAAAPNLPFYYYHIPSMTGVTFSMTSLVEAVRNIESFNNFAGIKYTGLYNTPGFMDVVAIAEDTPDVEILGGRDEMLPQMLAAGLKAFVGSQYNIIADLYKVIRDTFEAGKIKEARKFQRFAIDFIHRCLATGPGTNGFKAALNFAVPVGDSRLPGQLLQADQREALRLSLIEWSEALVAAGGPRVKLADALQAK